MKKQILIAFVLCVLIYIQPKVIEIQSNINGSEGIGFYQEEKNESKIISEYISNKDLVIKLTSEAGYSDSEVQTWLRIINMESTWNQYAKNPYSSSKSLYQILDSTWNWHQCSGDVFNVIDSTRCAIEIQRTEGWHSWSVY